MAVFHVGHAGIDEDGGGYAEGYCVCKGIELGAEEAFGSGEACDEAIEKVKDGGGEDEPAGKDVPVVVVAVSELCHVYHVENCEHATEHAGAGDETWQEEDFTHGHALCGCLFRECGDEGFAAANHHAGSNVEGAFGGEEDFYAGAEADEADFFSLGDLVACFQGADDAACDEAGD